MVWKILSFFLIAAFVSIIDTHAQDIFYQPFYAELHIAPQLNFGSHAEIKGGYDANSYDDLEHLNPAFKGSTATELVLGYGRKNWEFECTTSFFRQDMTLVKTIDFSTDGPKLATANFLAARVSALMLLTDLKWWPYGLYSGLFLGSVSSISYTVDPDAIADYGIKDISNQTQFNWGFDTHLNFALGKNGFFGNVGISMTLPGTLGCVGKIQMNSTGYTSVEDSIVMYSLRFFVGVGFRLGKQKSISL